MEKFEKKTLNTICVSDYNINHVSLSWWKFVSLSLSDGQKIVSREMSFRLVKDESAPSCLHKHFFVVLNTFACWKAILIMCSFHMYFFSWKAYLLNL